MPKPNSDKGNKRRPKISEIKISDLPEVNENDSAQLTCIAHYTDGTTQDITGVVDWEVDAAFASITADGVLATGDVTSDTTCQIKASTGAALLTTRF